MLDLFRNCQIWSDLDEPCPALTQPVPSSQSSSQPHQADSGRAHRDWTKEGGRNERNQAYESWVNTWFRKLPLGGT